MAFALLVPLARRGRSTALSNSLMLPKVVPKPCYELLRREFKSRADTQQREHRHGTTRLHHLIVTETEPVRNHVLLGEFALQSVRPDAVTQGKKEARIISREVSAGAHTLGCDPMRAKHHEQKCVLMMWRRLFLYKMQTFRRLAAPFAVWSDTGCRHPQWRSATSSRSHRQSHGWDWGTGGEGTVVDLE